MSPSTRLLFQEPVEAVTAAAKVSRGRFFTRFTTPPGSLVPCRIPAGPRSTSTRSYRARSNWCTAVRPE